MSLEMLAPAMQRSVDGNGWVLTWDRGSEMFEIDLMDTGRMGWYWRDRVADTHDGSEDEEEQPFSAAFDKRFRAFGARTIDAPKDEGAAGKVSGGR